MRDGWRRARLYDLCQVATDRVEPGHVPAGTPYVGLEHMPSDSPRVVRSGGTAGLTSQVIAFQPGDTLFGRLRPYLRKVGLAEGPGVCSPEILVLRPNTEVVLPAFLHAIVSSDHIIRRAIATSAGSRMPRTDARDLLAFDADLPPLAEQRRIVDLVGSVDSVGSHAQAHRSRALAAREALVESELSRYQDGPSLPLAQFADATGGLTKDQKYEAKDGLVRMPYLRVANVQRGYLDLSELTEVSVDPVRAQKLRLVIGDVLFNEGGDRDKLGRGWVWEGQVPFCIHQNHVLRARITDSDFDPYFVSIWGNSAFGRRWFEVNGAQTTNLASVSLSTLKRFPVPSIPLGEQRRIVALSEALGDVASRAKRLATRAVVLRAAVLTHLLSGAHEIPNSYDRFVETVA